MAELAVRATLENEVGQLSGQIETRVPLRLLSYVHLRNIHNSTGAGRVARQLTEHLAARSDVDMCILADPGDYARIVPLVGAPWSGYDYRFFSSETSRQQARWLLLNSPSAERFWPEAQVVFCTAESYVPVRRARLAVTAHDAAYFEEGAHRADRAFRLQRLKWRILYAKLARRVDLFHVVSEFSAARLAHFYPAIRERIRVVHNAVTPHFFEAATGAGLRWVAEAGLTAAPYVLVPGGLHFRKNAELILEAWPRLQQAVPNVTLAVVNHSHPEYAARLQALGGPVRLLGFVPDEALQALYSCAAAVWFPSRYEGFGLPVVEAMACGAPVVASDASSLPEISGGAALLVDPARPAAHVDALNGVLESATLRENLVRRGRDRAALFTWKAAAGKLREHFEGLL